ncbi:MAG: TonB-dependent receptor [Hyphomonas sp.]
MKSRSIVVTMVSVCALVSAMPAIAQETETSEEQDTARLNTITVTAQRREEDIQIVPVAVTAFSAEDLEIRSALNLEEVARSTPGLMYVGAESIKATRPSIRGISGGGGTAGRDSSIGVYVDDVYLGGPASANIELFDLERVEVLRGPQGTLFGRNTLAGVINMTSQKPDDELGGYVQAEYGNYDHKRLKGRVSVPLVKDKLSASLSGLYFDRDGFLENAYLNTDTNDAHQWGVRGALLYTPTDNIEWLISADYREVDQKAKSQETLINNPASYPGLLGVQLNLDPYDRVVYSGFAGEETLEAWGVSARGVISYDSFDLISVTSYREHSYYNDGESDQTPFGVGRNQDPEDVDRFTQEFRFETTGDGPFNAIAGVFYLDQDAVNGGTVILESDLMALLTGGVLTNEISGGAIGKTKTESVALFGNVGYDFTDKFSVSVGARQTWEDKSIDFNQTDFEAIFGFPLLARTGSYTGSDTFESFTPSFTAKYRFTDDVMAYATISEGFRSGGFNDTTGDLSGIAFGPEKLWNYEAGLKSTLFDDRLRFNASVFSMKWEDIQITADDPATPALYDPRILNAGEAHSDGVELEMVAAVTPALTIDGNFAYFDAAFDEGTSGGQPLGDLGAPEYTFNLNGTYVYALTPDLDLTFRGEYYRQGDQWVNLNQTVPENLQEGYELFNARVVLSPADADWELAIWGKNLTDETYNVNTFDLLSNPFVGQLFNVLGAPRTYGVSVRKSF